MQANLKMVLHMAMAHPPRQMEISTKVIGYTTTKMVMERKN